MDEMKKKLAFFMTKEAYKAADFRFIETKDGLIVRFDTHGKSVKEARTLINNVAATNREPFFIHVIHGYHSGTAIRDMIWNDSINPRFLRVKYQEGNQGTSIIKVAGVA